MTRVSIIVPVYNSDKFLSCCIDSILCQSFQDIEIIIIDDGSIDSSAIICDEYAKRDERIKVFHKIHSGPSDSRQIGIDNAVGDYIICCDSDDWMERNLVELLYESASKNSADVVICDYVEEFQSKRLLHKEFPKGFRPYDEFDSQIWSMSFSMCNKLINRSFFVDHNIRFYPGIIYAEDMFVILQILNKSPLLAYVSEPLYHYRRTCETSLTTVLTMESLESHQMVTEYLSTILRHPLVRIMDVNKCDFLVEVYDSKLLDDVDLKNLYPEIHNLLVDLSICNFKYIPLVKTIYRQNLIRLIHLYVLFIIRKMYRFFLQ